MDGAQTDTTDLTSRLVLVRREYRAAYDALAQAITAEEAWQPQAALDAYNRGLERLRRGLAMSHPTPLDHDPAWEEAAEMQCKMRDMETQVLEQIAELEIKLDTMPHGVVPSQSIVIPPMEAEELQVIESGVHLFRATRDGRVWTPAVTGGLRVMRFQQPTDDPLLPPAFLQACGWVYPLLPGRSPVLRFADGAYIFPDERPGEPPGVCMAVVLSPSVPLQDRELLNDLLMELANLRMQTDAASVTLDPCRVHGDTAQPSIPNWSLNVAQGINTGAEWLTWGLGLGAQAMGTAVRWGGEQVRKRVEPASRPISVDPRVATGLNVTRQAAGGVVKVSEVVVGAVSSAVTRMGHILAPHVHRCGSRLLPQSIRHSDQHGSTVDGAFVVAASGLKGITTVWSGLEQAAKTVSNAVSNTTADTVEHKYGEEAGQATRNAMDSAIDLGTAVYNVSHLGVKQLIKCTAKETGRAVITRYPLPEDMSGRTAQQQVLEDVPTDPTTSSIQPNAGTATKKETE
uniref:spartin-like n=1 Tax=Myxine glutinosa TaxID=7769 RepID=UPI00358E2659